jgi:dTMP kinase
MSRGLFVTFEGGEGSGKSTQMRLLADNLRADGLDVVTTREPGGTLAAEMVRAILLSGAAHSYGAEIEAVLFSAARRDHVETLIKPALGRGAIVLCDRYLDSTRVYQGASSKLDRAFITGVEAVAIGGLLPDVTFLIDIPAATGLERARLRDPSAAATDRFEREALEIHEERRKAYLALAAGEPNRFSVIRGDREEKAISNDIALIARSYIAATILRQEEAAQ